MDYLDKQTGGKLSPEEKFNFTAVGHVQALWNSTRLVRRLRDRRLVSVVMAHDYSGTQDIKKVGRAVQIVVNWDDILLVQGGSESWVVVGLAAYRQVTM